MNKAISVAYIAMDIARAGERVEDRSISSLDQFSRALSAVAWFVSARPQKPPSARACSIIARLSDDDRAQVIALIAAFSILTGKCSRFLMQPEADE